jgi:DNA replication protein DnaC
MTDSDNGARPDPLPLADVVAGTVHKLQHGERDVECPACHRPLHQVRFSMDGEWVPDRCAACVRGEEAAVAARVAARYTTAARSPVDQRIAALKIPAQYAALDLADFDPTVMGTADEDTRALLESKKRMAQAFVDLYPERATIADYPHLIVMRGDVGTGKTMLSWCIAKELVRRQPVTVVQATLADVVKDLREAWRKGDDGPSERARLRVYRNADLLLVDEMSRHALYGEPTQHLYDVLAPREADYRPTILTTNEYEDDIESFLGPALTSRVAGGGGVWNFGSLDYRVIRRDRRSAFIERVARE